MILIGTSGFQYPEWRGTFYPEGFPTAKMLHFYASHFTSTEINYTFRRLPGAKTLARWDAETPSAFSFSLKAPQRITHSAKLRGCEEIVGHFTKTIAALGPKLGVVLFQLPPFFKKEATVLREFLDILPRGLRAAFEFRHGSWFDEEIYATLRAHDVALCVAESETLATPPVFTASFAYFRLRKVDYSDGELARWAELARGQRDAFVYFKHEESGTGPSFARRFAELLPGLNFPRGRAVYGSGQSRA